MPSPHRHLRVDDDLWDQFGAAVGDGNRSDVLKQFMLWYVQTPDAHLPLPRVAITREEFTTVRQRHSDAGS